MKHATPMLLASLISFAVLGCAHQEPSLQVMNERAGYGDEAAEASQLNLSTSSAVNEAGIATPRREPREAIVWVHPQRISDREHFWGAWLTLRLEDEHWEARSATEYEQEAPQEKPKDGVTPVKNDVTESAR